MGLLAEGAASAQSATAADVCQRWTADRADLSEGASTADIASCTPGTWGAPGPANSLRLVNLYRFIAAMPAVTEDPSYDAFAQSCALLQAASATLSHTPDASAPCHSQMAATGSTHSSICSGPGVACIDIYMSDANTAEMGHRRWIFANYLGPVGFGSVGSGASKTGSCFYQPAGSNNAHMAFVAWPPGGNVPLQAITTTKADTAGWSLQSDTINLGSAAVTVMDGATNRAVTVSVLPANFGSTYAIRIAPSGWTSQAGHQYAVSVSGTSTAIAYTVSVVDCTTIDAGTPPPAADGGPIDAADSGQGRDASPAPAGAGSGSGGGGASASGSGTAGGQDNGDAAGPGAPTGASAGGSNGPGFGPSRSGGCTCKLAAGPRGEGARWSGAIVALLGLGLRRRAAPRG